MQKDNKKSNKRIGILTYHFSHNCGAVLQALALLKTVGKYADCTIIDYQPDYHASWGDYRYKYEYPPNVIKRIWNSNNSKIKTVVSTAYNMPSILSNPTYHKDRKRTKAFENFVNKNLSLSKRCKTLKDIELVSKGYDVLITGSDQVWNTGIVGDNYDDVYFLKVPNNVRRYSYAASAGNSWNEDNIDTIANNLKNFNGVSVRESELKNALEQKKISCRLDIDPSLLFNQEDYYEYEESMDVPSKYVFIYAFHITNELIKSIRFLKKKLRCEFISSPLNGELSGRVGFQIREIDHLGPASFLYLMHHANYVVTSTYHGLSFATIFRKPFVCLPPEHGNSRIENFLSIFNLQDCYWKYNENIIYNIDYSEYDKLLINKQKESIDYIKVICNISEKDG